jgi:hypothetical protein
MVFMKTLNRQEAHGEFNRLWNQLESEWFKVEVLQDYSGEDGGNSLTAWFNKDKEEAIRLLKKDAENNNWVKANKDKKFVSKRIHIVEEPYSEYLLWEIEHYKLINIPLAGEEVFMVNKNDVKDLGIPDGDFMIFDNKRIIRNYYTQDGKMYKADFYDESDDVSMFLELKSKLTLKAEPIK